MSPQISGNLFLFFGKFLERFTEYFPPLQNFEITVHLLTTTLFKGFFIAPADYSSVYLIITCTHIEIRSGSPPICNIYY